MRCCSAVLLALNISVSAAAATVPRIEPPTRDREAVDVAASGFTATPPAVLRVEAEDQPGLDGWLSWYARLERGTGPLIIETDLGDRQYGIKEGGNWAPVWRPVGAHRHAWRAAPGAYVGTRYRFALPKTAPSTVEIAFKPKWRYQDYTALWRDLAGLPHVHETRSSLSAERLPPFAYADVSAQVRERQAAGPLYLRSALITDRRAPGAKLNVVILFGQHPSEDQSDYFTEQWLLTLLSPNSDPAFERVRREGLRRFAFYVYHGNPLGRQAGNERYTSEREGDEDQNRVWHRNTSSQAVLVKQAIALDTGGRIAAAFDVHGSSSQDTSREVIGFFSDIGAPTHAFLAALRPRLDWHDRGPILSEGAYRTFHHWIRNRHDAVVSVTIEVAEGAPGYPDARAQFHEHTKALTTTLVQLARGRGFEEEVPLAELGVRRTLSNPRLAVGGAAAAGAAVLLAGFLLLLRHRRTQRSD